MSRPAGSEFAKIFVVTPSQDVPAGYVAVPVMSAQLIVDRVPGTENRFTVQVVSPDMVIPFEPETGGDGEGDAFFDRWTDIF